MKIGVIDVDGHGFPNVALMKISSYHKGRGDQVEVHEPLNTYDRVYMSKIFDFTPDYAWGINATDIEKGGGAYSKTKVLPADIEGQYPDYGLWQEKKAYGQLTRGCPRGCGFCDIKDTEGLKSRKVADLSQFWKDQKEVVLLDPNLLACPERMELLERLATSGAGIDFTQGLDIRLMNLDVISVLDRINIRMLHFAWDSDKHSELILKNLELYKSSVVKYNRRRVSVYVLVNYDTTIEFDEYRVNTLDLMGYEPFVQIYDKAKAPQQIKDLARWCNNKWIFRSCKMFKDYKTGGTKK